MCSPHAQTATSTYRHTYASATYARMQSLSVYARGGGAALVALICSGQREATFIGVRLRLSHLNWLILVVNNTSFYFDLLDGSTHFRYVTYAGTASSSLH